MIDSQNIQTHGINSKTDIQTASKLTSHYCAYTVKPLHIQKYLNSDRWTYSEFLTDIAKDPKYKLDAGTREHVAFIMLIELKQHTKAKTIDNLIGVRYFAMEQWYDMDVAVKWVKYLIGQIMATRKDFVGVSWPVDEYDTPLQEALKANGFKAVRQFSTPVTSLFYNGVEDHTTRIIFTLA